MPACQTWGHQRFLRTSYSRLIGPALFAVMAVHGALAFLSLRTVAPPRTEITAIAAFFVSPVVPSPTRQIAPAPSVERRATPVDTVTAPVSPQPRPLANLPAAPVSPPENATEPPVSAPPSPPAAVGAPVAQPAAPVVSATSESTVAAPLSVAIEAVRYLRPPQVVYPPLSRRLGETGRVLVRVVVDLQGVPVDVTVAEPSRHPRLNEQAVQALLQARFEPYRVNGRPMSVTVLAPIVFTLEDRP